MGINSTMLLVSKKMFKRETGLFLRYFSVFLQKYQNAKLTNKNCEFIKMPSKDKALLMKYIASCSARLFELNNICKTNLEKGFIIGRQQQELYKPEELEKLIHESFEILAKSGATKQIINER